MRLYHVIRFVVFVWVLSLAEAKGQEYFFKSYGIQEGFSRTVYNIVQDEDNYIWLGTGDGLFRFDGHDFELFTSEKYHLANNQVKVILIHSNGDIWMGHWNGGITRFDGNEFYTVREATNDENEDILSVEEDIDGALWFGTYRNGVFYIPDPINNDTDIINYKGGKLGSYITDITLLKDSTLLFNSEVFISTYNRDQKSFERYAFDGTNYAHKYCLLEDNDGFIWIGTHNDGLFKFDRVNNTFIHYDEKDGMETNIVHDLYQDSKGVVWAINIDDPFIKGGITRFSGNSLLTFNLKSGLVDNVIQCVFEDKEGNILIGTTTNGLSIFKGLQFEIFNTEDPNNNKPGLINNQVYAIYEDTDKNIWFGTDGGISVYDRANGSFKHYNNANSNISNKVRFIKGDKDYIWIGTEGGGLYRFTPQTKSFQSVYLKEVWNRDNIITALVQEEDMLWVGTSSGLIKFDLNTYTDRRLSDAENGLSGTTTITAIWKDDRNDGRLWIGALNSGFYYSDDGDHFNLIHQIIDVTPTCFIKDRDNQLWVGTNQGIYIFENDSVLVDHLSTSEGLLHNHIRFLNKLPNGDIFIGTPLGIHQYLFNEKRLYTYNDLNGFPGIEAKSNASYIDSQGLLWMGSAKGAVKYNAEFDKKKITEPAVLITKTLVNFEETDFYDGIKLRVNQNKIYFYYTSVNITNPKSVEYQVMLEGNDEDWQPATKESVSKYEALSPGKYTFKVKAKNSYGIWNEQPTFVSFFIKPPIYQTWYFIVGIILISLIGVIIFIKLRERNLIKEKRVLEQSVKERTIELSDANAALALRNTEITDSIRYAQRIQFSILPKEIPGNNTFVLFKPKDIVSGDFYWLNSVQGMDFMVAIDCTGHGVPGAFMSFIGYTSLNKIILEQGIYQPSEILKHLDKEVVKALHQEVDDEVKDGMDLSLVKWDAHSKTLEYAGAFNPAVIIRKGEIIEYKANRFAIGYSYPTEKDFTNHVISIEEDDMLYLYSDGYQDQFGGPKGKKFRSKPFKELLLSIAEKPVLQQQEILNTTIENWRGDQRQIDDILVIGRKF